MRECDVVGKKTFGWRTRCVRYGGTPLAFTLCSGGFASNGEIESLENDKLGV